MLRQYNAVALGVALVAATPGLHGGTWARARILGRISNRCLVDATRQHPRCPELASNRMFPEFVQFRVPGSDRVYLVTHASATRVPDRSGRLVLDVSSDPLAQLYESLQRVDSVAVPTVEGRAYLEVAEYFGPEWVALKDSVGRPQRELQFAEATHFSRIYLGTRGHPPMWEDPVVAPLSGPRTRFYLLSERAQQLLRGVGLPLP